MANDQTLIFSLREETNPRSKVKDIANALKEKGYDPVNQLVGYLLSEDPTYITTHKNARRTIGTFDRDELLKEIVKYFIQE